MAVFVFKILSIAIRTLARPLINWLSYYNRIKLQESPNKLAIFTRTRLILLGNNINYYNILLNRKVFGMTKETSTIKPLTDDKALERGAELISEIIVYTILLTIPIYEMIKSYKSNVQKEKKKKDYLIKMQTDVETLIEGNIVRGQSIGELNKALARINSGLYNV
jgi:hypothetical protein